MKREGWQQQGTVRINRSKLLRVAADEAAVVAAHGTKAPVVKPTNASKKTTGKCRRPRCASCHHHPVSKARDKAKGAHKLRACDVALNHRLVSWRVVVDGGAGHGAGIPDYKGTSASSLLAYLAGSGGGGSSWHEDEEEDGGSRGTAPLVNGGRLPDLYDIIVGRRADDIATMLCSRPEADPARAAAIIAAGDTDADAIEEQEQDVDEDGDEEENMSFCMVPITITVEFSDGEEDWIVVEEI